MRSILRIAIVLALGAGGVAHAQAAQTWVSGVGDDTNPCSRTAPCLTLAGALANTLPGGEIDALDAGDFGPVTITTSLTIDGLTNLDGVISGGITIAAGSGDHVILRNLVINGGGSGSGSGVMVTSAGYVEIDQCWISGFADGVAFVPAGSALLLLNDVVSKDNSSDGIRAGSAGGIAGVTVYDSRSEGNDVGIHATAGGRIDVYDSDASHNATAGVSADLAAAGGSAEINLESVDASENGTGVRANAVAGSAIVRMSKVLGTANLTAPVATSGNGLVLSFGNNRLDVLATLALSTTMSSATVIAGGAASYPLDVTATGLVANPISFACSGLPAGANCIFTPTTLPAGSESGSVTLSISTTSQFGPDAGFVWPTSPLLPPFIFIAFALGWLLLSKRPELRRPLGAVLAIFAFVVGVSAIAACGSSVSQQDMAMMGGSHHDLSVSPPHDMSLEDMSGSDMSVGDLGSPTPDLMGTFIPTPAGTYTVTVTATSGTLTATQALTLVVN